MVWRLRRVVARRQRKQNRRLRRTVRRSSVTNKIMKSGAHIGAILTIETAGDTLRATRVAVYDDLLRAGETYEIHRYDEHSDSIFIYNVEMPRNANHFRVSDDIVIYQSVDFILLKK